MNNFWLGKPNTEETQRRFQDFCSLMNNNLLGEGAKVKMQVKKGMETDITKSNEKNIPVDVVTNLQCQLNEFVIDEDDPGLCVIWNMGTVDTFTTFVSNIHIVPLQTYLQPFINASTNNNYNGSELILAIRDYLLHESQGALSIMVENVMCLVGTSGQWDKILMALMLLIVNPPIQFGLYQMNQLLQGHYTLGYVGKLCSNHLSSIETLNDNIPLPFLNPFRGSRISKV